MTGEQESGRRMSSTTGWLGWLIGIPVASAIVAAVIGLTGWLVAILLVIPLLVGARLQLKTLDYGGLWQIATWACAAGIALPCILGAQAYVALRGDEVNAVVVKQTNAVTHRISDPATNEDLGELTGKKSSGASYYKVGDRVQVFVAKGFSPLPANRTSNALTAARIWLGCWLLGFVLLFVLRVRRARVMRR